MIPKTLKILCVILFVTPTFAGGEFKDGPLLSEDEFNRLGDPKIALLDLTKSQEHQMIRFDGSPTEIWFVIHGFNTSRPEARHLGWRVSQEIINRRNETARAIAVVWDGDQKFGLAETQADNDGHALAEVLAETQRTYPEARISIVTHSLGARVALRALAITQPWIEIDYLALVQPAVRAPSIHAWIAEPVRIIVPLGSIAEWPSETCEGEFYNAVGAVSRLLVTQAEGDWVLARAFGADDAFNPHFRRCFVPQIANRASIFRLGDSIAQRALGLPFVFDEQDFEVLPHLLPPWEDMTRPAPRILNGLDPFDGHDYYQFELPLIEAYWNFSWSIGAEDTRFVDLQNLLERKPDGGWHNPLSGRSLAMVIAEVIDNAPF